MAAERDCSTVFYRSVKANLVKSIMLAADRSANRERKPRKRFAGKREALLKIWLETLNQITIQDPAVWASQFTVLHHKIGTELRNSNNQTYNEVAGKFVELISDKFLQLKDNQREKIGQAGSNKMIEAQILKSALLVEDLLVSIACLKLLAVEPEAVARNEDLLISTLYDIVDPSPVLSYFGYRFNTETLELGSFPLGPHWAGNKELLNIGRKLIPIYMRARSTFLQGRKLEKLKALLERDQALANTIREDLVSIVEVSKDEGGGIGMVQVAEELASALRLHLKLP